MSPPHEARPPEAVATGEGAHRQTAYDFGSALAASSDSPEDLAVLMHGVACGAADAWTRAHPVALGRDPRPDRVAAQISVLTVATEHAARMRDTVATFAWVNRLLSGAELGKACGISREAVHRRFRR